MKKREFIYIAVLTLNIAVVLSAVFFGVGHIFGVLNQSMFALCLIAFVTYILKYEQFPVMRVSSTIAAPIEAEGYMYIDCLWVSGQFKGHGYSNLLLDACTRDSKTKGKNGLVLLSSKKKMGFLSDPKYMSYKGFQTADTAEPYFEPMYLPA